MENATESTQVDLQPQKKRGFWGWLVVFLRWGIILFFAAILLGGLYFKAPWKVLMLDGLLLALLTVVPQKKRKYGWLTLAVVVAILIGWVFLPESDPGEWRPYTFDEELAVLEAARAVRPEADAAELYEVLFDRWEQIEENDPFPDEADDDCITPHQPWTAEEFPEVAAWFERNKDFFQDVIEATQKPDCYFPAAVTILDLSDLLERVSPFLRFIQHLIRASYLDIGENRKGAWEKQVAALNIGKHINQQPMLTNLLTGVSFESLARTALKKMLLQQSFPEDISEDDLLAMTMPIRLSHFDHQEKWQQLLAYEKLCSKNFIGMFYEINPHGKIRFTRGQWIIDLINQEALPEDKAEFTYWRGVCGKFSAVTMWFGGLPKDPMEISRTIDHEWKTAKKSLHDNDVDFPKIDELFKTSVQFNYINLMKTSVKFSFSLFKKMEEILERSKTQKEGIVLACDLVLHKKRHGQYPDALEELWSSKEDKQTASELYSGFVYEKTGDSFKLYHIGPNEIDENGVHLPPKFDPNDVSFEGFMEMKPESDDILIWPEKLIGK